MNQIESFFLLLFVMTFFIGISITSFICCAYCNCDKCFKQNIKYEQINENKI